MSDSSNLSEVLGFTRVPTTVEEAIELLERVADDRSEYVRSIADRHSDVGLSVDVLRAAARILRSGDIGPWVPSWKWHLYQSDEGQT